MARQGTLRSERHRKTGQTEPGSNRSMYLTDSTWEAWRFWLNQKGMSYEEGIRFVMEQLPIELKVPGRVRVTRKKGE